MASIFRSVAKGFLDRSEEVARERDSERKALAFARFEEIREWNKERRKREEQVNQYRQWAKEAAAFGFDEQTALSMFANAGSPEMAARRLDEIRRGRWKAMQGKPGEPSGYRPAPEYDPQSPLGQFGLANKPVIRQTRTAVEEVASTPGRAGSLERLFFGPRPGEGVEERASEMAATFGISPERQAELNQPFETPQMPEGVELSYSPIDALDIAVENSEIAQFIDADKFNLADPAGKAALIGAARQKAEAQKRAHDLEKIELRNQNTTLTGRLLSRIRPDKLLPEDATAFAAAMAKGDTEEASRIGVEGMSRFEAARAEAKRTTALQLNTEYLAQVTGRSPGEIATMTELYAKQLNPQQAYQELLLRAGGNPAMTTTMFTQFLIMKAELDAAMEDPVSMSDPKALAERVAAALGRMKGERAR